MLTQQRDFVLQQLVVPGGEDAHGLAGHEAPLLHQPLARPHQGGGELGGVHTVVTPTADAIRHTLRRRRKYRRYVLSECNYTKPVLNRTQT